MARYDYRCEDCTEIFEVDLPMGQEKPPQECPICGSYRTTKVIFEAPALSIEWGPNGIGDTTIPKYQGKVQSKRRVELEEV